MFKKFALDQKESLQEMHSFIFDELQLIVVLLLIRDSYMS